MSDSGAIEKSSRRRGSLCNQSLVINNERHYAELDLTVIDNPEIERISANGHAD